MDINGDDITLINDKGDTHTIGFPPEEELAKNIKDAVEAGEKEVFVSVLEALKQEQIVGMVLKDFEDNK